MKARESATADAAPIAVARRVFTRPGAGYFAMTISRASLTGRTERLEERDDSVDLGIGERASKGRHQRARLAVPHHLPELRDSAAAPEIRIAKVSRMGLHRRRRGTVAGSAGPVARGAALLVDHAARVGLRRIGAGGHHTRSDDGEPGRPPA